MLSFKEAYLLFLGPDPASGISGGNIFNQRFLKSLQEEGITTVGLDDWPEIIPKNLKHIVVDSLYISSAAQMQEIKTLKKRRPYRWFLLHHLHSMYPRKDIDSDEYFYKHEKPLLQHFNRFIVTSPYSKSYLENRGFQKSKIEVLKPYPFSMEPFSSPENKPPNVLILSNLISRKGILPFLNRLTKIKAKPKFRLVIHGRKDIEPDYAEQCISLIQKTPGVRYEGPIPPMGTSSLWSQYELLLSPAYLETFGMSLHEAKYAGIVRMAVNGGYASNHIQKGYPDLLAEDPEELAENFVNLLSEPSRLSKYRKEAIREQKTLPDPDTAWNEQIREFVGKL